MDSLQERITAISDYLDNRQPVTQLQVQGIVQRASALSSQVTTIINDIGIENIDRHTIMMTRELKAGNYDILSYSLNCCSLSHQDISHTYFVTIAIFEANKAAKTLLIENATEPQQLRVIKRCELILNVVQRLQPALSMIMNSTIPEKSVRTQGDSSRGMINNSI